MNTILYIKWDSGEMNINMGYFFPCSAAKYNKLLKIIRMDDRSVEVLSEMKQFFQKRIPELEQDFQTNGRLYCNYLQKEADTKRIIESRKYPNGVPLSKDELKETKKGLKEFIAKKNACERYAIRAKKDKEWFEQKVGELNG